MDSDTLQVFQSELTCSICMNCFLDPITIDCGHSFCRPCLSLCWEEGQTPRSCPECRGIAERPDFKTNIVLKRLASLARQARADHDRRSEEQICETHQEARGLFCEADQTLPCGPCPERPEHAAHSHSPIHRAAEESRDYVALRKVMIKLKYQRILRLLRDEEQLHLRALEKEAKEIYEQLKEIVFRMTQQRESLKEIDRELMEMCHMLDMELLQLCSTKVNSQYILSTTSPPFVQFVKRPLGKIGVFLDYDKGTVSFYDVFRSSLIYSSLPSAFSSPLIPFLCLKSP
ncbi:hypothetical protein G4228_001183 [Cervus hanglu yarkandensis]|nr:hypothetical protein G4228_001183 [Cervus hanglu yarkandensis]